MSTNHDTIAQLFEAPLLSLLLKAQHTHHTHFDRSDIDLAGLINIKLGSCPEDCCFCSQSAHYKTHVHKKPMMSLENIIDTAKHYQSLGIRRCCMVAAMRGPNKKDFPQLLEMVRKVKALGMETCLSTGILSSRQACALKEAGLDFYNHNIETSEHYYKEIVTTHNYQSRIDTLRHVHEAGIKTCSGGIIGMGETRADRIDFVHNLANLDPYPTSIPINRLISFQGTPLKDKEPIDFLEYVRTIAVVRITMPKAIIRLSGGRETMSETEQTLAFLAGANSIHTGGKLLTIDNQTVASDQSLINKLALHPLPPSIKQAETYHETFSA